MNELARIDAAEINLEVLKLANIVPAFAKKAKIIDSGVIEKAVTLKGLAVTKGARSVIEAQGGKVED